jgi:HK97 family phage prohead protease
MSVNQLDAARATTIDRRPPRDNLVRESCAHPDVLLLRDAGEKPAAEASDSAASAMPTMIGHFAVFNRWTEIDSFWEGNFMESIAPGAFKRSIENNRDSIRTLFQHGRDPSTGALPLGTIDVLREDDVGAYYEVDLFDADYVQRLLPSLRSNQLGASFRFQVTREEVDEKPDPSPTNPTGMPQRTIKDLVLYEFGPVTFPAYDDASAGLRMRSATDEWIVGRFGLDPSRLHDLLHHYGDRAAAPDGRGLGAVHSAPSSRSDPPRGRLEVVRNPTRGRS